MPTILYADDEKEHRMMMQVIMKNQGLNLIEAANGQEAIDQIKVHHPDLVLLDLFMPRVDGFGVLKTIKTDPSIRRIPIIVLSAWPTGDNRERAKSFGAVGFIAKPYDPIRLVEVIKSYLDEQSELHLDPAAKKDTAPLNP